MELKERNAKIMALVNSGSTYQQAADAVGVTRNTVAGVVYRERRALRAKLDRIPEVVLPKFAMTPTSIDDLPPMDKLFPHRKGVLGRIADWIRGRA